MHELINFLQMVLSLGIWVIMIHVIMSWLISFQVLNLRQQFVAQVWYGLNRLLAPVYDPIRRRMPNFGTIDLTPLVLFFGIIFLRDVVLPNIARVI